MDRTDFQTRPVVTGRVTAYTRKDAGHCPFCHGQPVIEPWHGGGPDKHAVHCDDETCMVKPMVVGETRQTAIYNWNWRPGKDLPREDPVFIVPD